MKKNTGPQDQAKFWKFIDEKGTFEWIDPHPSNQLYFPICNEAGMMASVTPTMHGDATTGQHSFVRLPLVMEDLHNTRSARNFWIYNETLGAYSLTGNSARQIADSYHENAVKVTVQGTFLTQKQIREDLQAGLTSEVEIFSPVTDDKVEIIRFKITNNTDEPLVFVPTSGFPVYGRSAENLRDHNHWTSLSHRIEMDEYGLLVKPMMHHDESGHKPNHTTYFVLAVAGDGKKPIGQFPTVLEFIGDGSFEWPEAVVKNIPPYQEVLHKRDGMEVVGAIRFPEKTLSVGESCEYIVIEGTTEDKARALRCIDRFGNTEKVNHALEESIAYWTERVERISFETGDKHFDCWMHWVALQPILRKIYGNSFLTHFDYGKGGRGWRDLWQDCLALLLQNPEEMKASLIANFGGVRLDGSNATIIQKELGEFAADRNKISRVWMDHGVWPYFTLKLYIDQTGDLDAVFENRKYWKDHQIRRAKGRDNNWNPADGTWQKNTEGKIYEGTIMEHILVQHLTCFCNVGEHNNMKLEDADWNDLLDMANVRGETVPFSAFYGWNLLTISDLLLKHKEIKQVDHIEVFEELLLLTGMNRPLNLDSPEEKQASLLQYYECLEAGFSGKKINVAIDKLATELIRMGKWALQHIRHLEWIESVSGHGFFNGYYNNDGLRVDGDQEAGPRMNLTAQTFAIMSGAATDEQLSRSYAAAGSILKDPNTGGYRLTTPLGPNTWNLGRGFAVVYGEKETGGAFNHMIVMFMNGLYRRGFVNEAYEVFTTIYRLANHTEKAKIYPGIPEYISSEGQGKYHYLSGSASWLLMTVLTEMFGVKGEYGDLVLSPKLVKEQFDASGQAKAFAFFQGKRISVNYQNPQQLDFMDYSILDVKLNGLGIEYTQPENRRVRIDQILLKKALIEGSINQFEVTLG